MKQCQFTKLKYSSRKNTISLKGNCPLGIGEGYLLLQERIKGNDLFIPRDIQIPCKVKRGAFIAEFDLSLLSDMQSHDFDIWDCFFVSREGKQRVMYPGKNISPENFFTDCFMFIFYQTSNSEFSIKVQKNNTYQANLLSFAEKEGKYLLKGAVPELKLDSFSQAFLSIRKRDNKNSILYKDETNIPLTILSSDNWEATVDKQLVFPTSHILHEEVWDVYLKLESNVDRGELYLPLLNQTDVNDHYSVIQKNPFYEAKFYINKKQWIALWIKRKPVPFELSSLNIDGDGTLTILCKNAKSTNMVGTRVEIEMDKWSDILGGFYADGHINSHDSETELTYSLKQLKDLYHLEANDQFNLMVLIEDKETHAQTWMPLSISNFSGHQPEIFRLTLELTGVIKLSAQHSVVIQITDLQGETGYRNEPVKLAVLGTCYTRGAFNSNAYFNPGYKEKYDVVYTQFHSSLPSLMSSPVHFPREYFTDKKPLEIEYLQCDFEKTFFKQLAEAKAEYFLFDLYPDAVRDLVVYDDEHVITGNFYLRNRKFLQSLTNKVKFISHDNEEEFLKYWCPAAEQFTKKILEFFPQERIILQKARMTNRYYDKDRSVKYFTDQLDLVKRSNVFYKYMESFILQRLPKIHTIDLNQYGYIGQYNHPYLKSTNHYEPAYYKKLMVKLDKIVFGNESSN